MKSTKKVLSIVLSVLMILSTVTCSFVAFAAAKGVTAEQYQALADAVKSETVAQACAAATGSQNSYTIEDPDGSVLAAADAYWAVVSGLYDSAANQNNTTTRNLGLIKGYIVTQLQNGGYITAGEAAQATSIINAFACNTNVPTGINLTSASYPTVTLKIDCGEAAILKYASIDDMPDTIVTGRTYTTSHSRTNAGYSWSPKYYVKISKLATTDTTAKKSDFVAYQTTFAQYDDIYAKNLDALVAMGSTDLGNAKTALNNAYNAVANKFSDEVFEKFYGDYAAKVEAILPLIDQAVAIIPYVTIAEKITELCATDFSEFDATQLTTLESNIKTQLTNYNKASAETKAYVEGKGYVDLANAQETLTAVTYAKEVLKLTALKEEIDGKVDVYSAYTEAQVADGDITGAQLSAANAEIGSYITSLGSYVEATVVEVCGENYVADLTALRATLNDLIVVAGYRADFMKDYEKYLNEVNSALNIPDDSEELLAAVQGYDEWYAGLNELTAKIEAELGEETANRIFTDLNDKMTALMEAKYAALEARVTAQIEAAYIVYTNLYEAYGEEVTIATLASYKNLEKSVGLIEKDIIDFFAETENHDLAEATLATYAKLEAALENYAAFNQSAGFDRFETSEIADIVRKVTDKDVVRDEDYTVNDEMVEAIIKLLDKVLGSDEIKDILGLDLKGTLTGLLDKIYTNDLINTVVQYVYPLVAEQFVNIWSGDLPDVVPADNPIGSGKIDVKVTYKSIEDAMKSIRFFVFPQILGEHIAEAYPNEQLASAAAQLQKVTDSAYDKANKIKTNTWADPAICDEEGKLTLDWGVTDRETFLNAAEAALSGLEPLLLALLSNVAIDGAHNEDEHKKPGNENYFLTQPAGSGTVATGSTSIWLIFTIPVTVNMINLYLDVQGNSGYNNALVPIFEALGMENLPDGDTLTSTRSLLDEGLLKPVEAFLAKLGESPVETLATALPNLAYGIEAGLVVPLLKMLKVDINYHADAHHNGASGIAAGWVMEALSDGPISINIGEMINLEEMGLDVSSLNGILSLVSGLLGVELPAIDGTTLATLGTLTQKDTGRNEKTYTWGEDGKAAYIEANKADVLLFVLNYVLDALKDEDFLKGIIAAINSSDDVEDPEKAEEVITTELPAIVKEIIKNVTTNKDDAIAAIAELIMPKKYADANGDINWAESSDAPEVIYTSEAWTREKAQFIVKNFPNTVNNILKIAGVKIGDVKTDDLPALIDALLDTLYTADNVNAIAQAISGLTAGLDDTLKALVASLIDVDLAYWDDFSVSFKDGDRDAFVAGLQSVLEPLTGLLKFVICGDDFKASVTNGGKIDVITLKGYDSYTNGIIPLFEALGATKVMTPDEFKADSDNIVSNLIASVLSAIDNLQADPYNKVLDLLLNVVYFIASDGVQVVVDNVLHGIDVVLDTIRPIYDINLTELLGFDIRFAESDPITFLFIYLNKMIYDETGVDLAFDFTAKQLYENLAFGDREAYTSANGKTAYRINAVSNSAADLVTVIGRYLVSQLVAAENTTKLADLAKEKFGLDNVTYRILYSMLATIAAIEEGPDYVLALVFYIFFGADTAVDAVADYYKYYSYDWAAIIKMLQNSDASYAQKAAYLFKQVYEKTFETIFDDISEDKDLPINSEDIRGFAKLLRTILDEIKGFFEMIAEFFRSITK